MASTPYKTPSLGAALYRAAAAENIPVITLLFRPVDGMFDVSKTIKPKKQEVASGLGGGSSG